jgi:hypothetical protein
MISTIKKGFFISGNFWKYVVPYCEERGISFASLEMFQGYRSNIQEP